MSTEVTAKLSYLRIGPRKVRLAADLVRGKKALKAVEILSLLNKKAAHPVRKLISSAIANAEHNYSLPAESLRVSEILVDEGPTLKRWTPKARGRATTIRKRTSHVKVTLASDYVKPETKKTVKKTEDKNQVAKKRSSVKKSETAPAGKTVKKTAAKSEASAENTKNKVKKDKK